jgi:hypothetical protein
MQGNTSQAGIGLRCQPERVQLLSELDTPLMRWTLGRRVGTGVVRASIVHTV